MGAIPDDGTRETLSCEAEFLVVPKALLQPIQEAPAVVVDNGGPLVSALIFVGAEG